MEIRLIFATALLPLLAVHATAQPAIKKITYTDVSTNNGVKQRSTAARVVILFLKKNIVAMRFPDESESETSGKLFGNGYVLKNRFSSYDKKEGKTFTTAEEGIIRYRAGTYRLTYKARLTAKGFNTYSRKDVSRLRINAKQCKLSRSTTYKIAGMGGGKDKGVSENCRVYYR